MHNDIDRRLLLGGIAGAAGIAALSAIAKAGPLTPPAGAVVPTGRTLDEVYNKIPGANGSGDGRTLIPGGGAFTISAPGSYLLTGNLSSASSTLTIAADNVTLDLNGFTVASTSTTVTALLISGTRSNVTIRHGIVRGGSSGVGSSGTVMQVLIEDVCAIGAKFSGIVAGLFTCRGWRVKRCHVSDTGITTTIADGTTTVTGISLLGASHTCEDCTVERLHYNGSGAGTLRGISAPSNVAQGGIGVVISRCTVTSDVAITATGVQMAGRGLYRDNSVTEFSTPYSAAAATNGGGNA